MKKKKKTVRYAQESVKVLCKVAVKQSHLNEN
jgi:hypothetical protein